MNSSRHPEPQTVTVLIAAYNAEGFLQRAVRSALDQTVPVLEVLVVDDSSTDRTVEVVEQLAREDGRIRLLKMPKNGGPSAARNAGLDAAKGEWVAILDADDAMASDRVERMIEAGTAHCADVVADNLRYYSSATKAVSAPILDMTPQSQRIVSLEEFLENARPFGPRQDWGLLHPMFRRSFLEGKRLRYPLRSRHGEDFLLLVEAFLQGARYLLLGYAGYMYTGRGAGMSRTILNYDVMALHTEDLMNDERIAGRARILASLKERAEAVRLLKTESELARCWRQRALGALVRRMLVDPRARALIAERLVRTVRRARRR